MTIKNLLFSVTVVFAMWGTVSANADGPNKDILVSDAWVQAMPPSQTTTAAYMVITNNAAKEAVLVSASSDIAATTEIHQMSDMDGMMKMDMVSDLHIPALGKAALKPGGFHIMLIGLKKPVDQGDSVAITLHFKNGINVPLIAVAKKNNT
jgi:copper(I)-binding protein